MTNLRTSCSFLIKLTFLPIFFCFSSCNGQNKSSEKTINASAEIEKQISQFENGLSGRVLINGKGENIIERMKYYNVKGLSIAVVNNYEIVWAKGYGIANETTRIPVTTSTLFKSGSVSKSLNAVGILKLVQDRKLDLNKDINDYLVSWKFPYDSLSKGKKITLSQLLSHTAGLSLEGGFLGYENTGKIPTVPEILDGKGTTPAVRSLFEPGLKFKYSGGGILISQLIIEDVTHQKYEKYMKNNVLDPLGMNTSYYSTSPPQEDQLKSIAIGYSYLGFKAERLLYYYPEQAALGLWTTPSELCNYIIATQLAYEGKSSKVLNQEMTRIQLTPPGNELSALGFFIEKRGSSTYFKHDGRHGGFCSIFYGSLEKGQGVAIMINCDDNSIFEELINSVATVYDWNDFYTPVKKNEIQVSDDILKSYIGIYQYDNKFSVVLVKDGGYYLWTNGIYSKMHFSSDSDFFNQEFTSDKTFIRDTKGNVTGYSRSTDGTQQASAVKITVPQKVNAPVDEINNLAWQLLETNQVSVALLYLERAHEIDNHDIPTIIALAHCYLFNSQYDKAIKIYKENLNKEIGPNLFVKGTIPYHFAFLKKYGYDTKLMEKVFAELNLEIPEYYLNVNK